jgi:hypothetical protein
MMKQPKWMTYLGWAIAALLTPAFGMSAYFKFFPNKDVLEGMNKFDIPMKFVTGIGIVEVACVLLWLFPRTAVLGAILLTGYLGGAIMTHLRINDNFAAPVIVGVLVWLSVFLREPRLRQLMPWRQPLDLPQTK